MVRILSYLIAGFCGFMVFICFWALYTEQPRATWSWPVVFGMLFMLGIFVTWADNH